MQLSTSVPRVSIRHMDGKIPLLDHTPLPTPLAYLKYTFSVNLLSENGWCNQINLTM
jgi:hypothetical protein